MREIKFRGKTEQGEWVFGYLVINHPTNSHRIINDFALVQNAKFTDDSLHHIGADINLVIPETVGQFTGICDRNGREIYFGDTLRFADKLEWYRGSYWAKVAFGEMTREQALKEIDEQPYEERLIEGIEDYEWLLSGEIQTYWEVVTDSNNIHENQMR